MEPPMRTVIRNERLVADDRPVLAADEAADAGAAAIVPLARWLEWRAAGRLPHPDTGVWLQPDEDFEALLPDLARLPLIAVNFPVFTDGRGYSVGRLLRERHGYRGELRAIGDVLRDQLYFLRRCGFDAFALRADQDAEAALQAFDDYSVSYQ
jgi:uncharacterized protein (DUF934 family)